MLGSGVNLIQMMLGWRFGHELPYTFVKSAISYQIWSSAKGGANTFIVKAIFGELQEPQNRFER